MATIALTADRDTASIVIRVGGMTSGDLLTRTDRNGTAAVRLMNGQGPIDGLLVARDHEAALFGPVTYKVAGAVATERLDAVRYPYVGVEGDRLARVVTPQDTLTPRLVLDKAYSRDSKSTHHDIINRLDPVTVEGGTSLERGTITYLTDTQGLADLEKLYAPGGVLLLRHTSAAFERETAPLPIASDLYHTPNGWSVRSGPTVSGVQLWEVSVGYLQKYIPTFPVAGSIGWDFDSVKEMFTSFNSVRDSFEDFDALTVGP